MKRTFLLLSFATSLSIHQHSRAQTQLPNSGCENWTVAANGKDSLVGWSSSNTVVITPVTSLYKSQDTFSGSFAAMIVTAPFGFVQYSTIGILVNGNALFDYGGGGNTVNTSHASGGGTPISYKPTAVHGYYKYEFISGGDMGLGVALLTKYNTMLHKRDTISIGQVNFTMKSSYTPFTIPLVDQKPGVIPDSITCVFYSSNPATVPTYNAWSNLYLDSLYLGTDGPTGTDQPENMDNAVDVFPNPSNGVFTIRNNTSQPVSLGIYDATGRNLKSIALAKHHSNHREDLSILASGVYYLVPDNKHQLAQKIIVIR